MCPICYTEPFFDAPVIQLATCNHLFHRDCLLNILNRRWIGNAINFTFTLCPLCKIAIEHPTLTALLQPILELQETVKAKALVRLDYDGLTRSPEITTPGGEFYNDPTGFAMKK